MPALYVGFVKARTHATRVNVFPAARCSLCFMTPAVTRRGGREEVVMKQMERVYRAIQPLPNLNPPQP